MRKTTELPPDTPVRWEIIPMNSVRLDKAPVKAITSKGGLKKGQVYYLSRISSRGKVALIGNHDRLYDMGDFVAMRYAADEPLPSTDKLGGDNDNKV